MSYQLGTVTENVDHYVLRVVALTGTIIDRQEDTPERGALIEKPQYIAAYLPDAHDGLGAATFTEDIGEALRFGSPMEALQFYRQRSTVRPFRADGLPNRPLTAVMVEVVPVPEPNASAGAAVGQPEGGAQGRSDDPRAVPPERP